MAHNRVKKGRPVSGWIVLDKPLEMGSTQAVAKIKWLFGAQKVGHAGTLDPLATGVLPVALGEATKTVPYVMDGTKIYRFEVTWGARTNTDDLEGEVIATSNARPQQSDIEAILPEFTGVISQVPPQFSAIKVEGNRAYDMARDGEAVELAARDIEIDRLAIVRHETDRTLFEVECGKGTYVRSLARDMGEKLGCHGHVSLLRRTVVDPFEEADAISLNALIAAAPAKGDDAPDAFAKLDALLIDTGMAMGGLPRVDMSDDQANRIRLGNPAIIRGRDAPVFEEEACAFQRGTLLAVGRIEHGAFHPKRVFKI